ncbi:golgin subfamily A member 6-like protein 7 isoform X1 [Drosophila takahashii]|uniref:golgin subfamily A member 6-like protein 7 isoform X1 n=2 Tax=Drosophila takahashii TaxID=29030 RepID=UPI003898F1DE
MTHQENKHAFPSNVRDVAEGVERLVRDTNQDLRNFRQEQAHLRVHVNGVVEENRRLNSELAKCRNTLANGDYQDLKQRLLLTNNALDAAKKQVEELLKERKSLQTMQDFSKRTIENMELELRNYRVQMQQSGDDQIIQRYSKAIKMLESKVIAQQEELRTQAETIRTLHEHKQSSGEQVQQLQSQLRDLDQDQVKVSSLQKQLKEYELSLSHTHNLLMESTRRETTAMRKVEEAITLSEEATREKMEAKKLAEAYKEEVTQLATNIGTIMEEASTRVDTEVAQLKNRLKQKDNFIATIKEKLKKQSAEHKSVVHLLETRNNRLEHKYKEVLKQNDKLEAEVEVTCRRLTELERSLNEVHCEDDQDSKMKQHYESQMERYLLAHKQMKSSYRVAMDDITQRFESVIYQLRKENSELLADNELLKSGAAGDGTRQPL